MKNILGRVPIKYLAVKEGDFEKCKDCLKEQEILFQEYRDAHEIISHEEAKSSIDRLIDENKNLKITDDDKNKLEQNVFNDLDNSRYQEYGIYDSEYIYDTVSHYVEEQRIVIMTREGILDEDDNKEE